MTDPGSVRAARAAALVTQMAVITVLGGWLGGQLDARFNTAPWLLVSGFVGGFALGLVPLFTVLLRDDEPEPPDPAA